MEITHKDPKSDPKGLSDSVSDRESENPIKSSDCHLCYCRKRTPQKIKPSDGQSQKHTTEADGPSALLPPKPKSRRTSSTTVSTATLPVKTSSSVVVLPVENVPPKPSMPIAKRTQSPHMLSVSPFGNNSENTIDVKFPVSNTD
uniref:Flocculation protein FLO11-like n=1 Tax=Panagrellus redivivus TaxID=6233 RepID=A0A7E4UYV6_PANRE